MKANRVMTKTVHCITPDVPLAEAWAAMQRWHVRHLPVLWGDQVAGILSDRDLLLHASKGLSGEMHFHDVTAADAMTPRPVTALTTATVASLARQMLERHIDSIPIVSRAGRLEGLVTSADLLELLAQPDPDVDTLPFDFTVSGPEETLASA